VRFRAGDLDAVRRPALGVQEHTLASCDELTCECERRVTISQYGDRREDVRVGLHLTDVVSLRNLRHHHVAGFWLAGRCLTGETCRTQACTSCLSGSRQSREKLCKVCLVSLRRITPLGQCTSLMFGAFQLADHRGGVIPKLFGHRANTEAVFVIADEFPREVVGDVSDPFQPFGHREWTRPRHPYSLDVEK
jgi:hypothetical protein